MNNNVFKQQLQRYIDGELDTIYEELPKMSMQPKRPHQQHDQQQHQPTQQQYYHHQMNPVYTPYEQEEQRDIYGVEYLDKTSNDNAKRLSVELAEKVLKTQTKIDYYKAMKKKASIKLEEHLKRKDNDCEPLIQLLLSTTLDNVIHDGHKFTVVNGKNKKYIKITKLK